MSSSRPSTITKHGSIKAPDINFVSISVECIKDCEEAVFILAESL